MSTTNYEVDASAWTQVSASDNLLMNKGSVYIRVHYGAVPPALNTKDFYPLDAGKAIVKKDNEPAGNTYVRTDLPDGDTTKYDVVVGE